jgi:hypothetical protein
MQQVQIGMAPKYSYSQLNGLRANTTSQTKLYS